MKQTIKAIFSLFFAAVLMAGVSGVAAATDADGEFTVFGAGTKTCETYNENIREDPVSKYVYFSWILGYITAMGDTLSTKKPFGSVANLAEIEDLLDTHCAKNPSDDIIQAAKSVTLSLQVKARR